MTAGVLPNLIIAGANKAGTTSLFTYLTMHPDACGSKRKETCYFLPLRYGEPLAPLDEYRRQFRGCADNRLILESTPGYFYGGLTIAEAIDRTLPGVRVVIVLREPVERLISFYRFQKSMLNLGRDEEFAEYVSKCGQFSGEQIRKRENNAYFGLEGGCYSNYLSDWVDTFGDRLRVIFFDDLVQQKQETVNGIWRWSGLQEWAGETGLHIENKTRGYRSTTLQRIAISANRILEPVWRRNAGIKRVLRDLYFRLNGRPNETAFDEEIISSLKEYFAEPNRRLREQLVAAGVTRLPIWLAERDSE